MHGFVPPKTLTNEITDGDKQLGWEEYAQRYTISDHVDSGNRASHNYGVQPTRPDEEDDVRRPAVLGGPMGHRVDRNDWERLQTTDYYRGTLSSVEPRPSAR